MDHMRNDKASETLYFDDNNMLIIDDDIMGESLKDVKKMLDNELNAEPEYDDTSFDIPVYNYKFLKNDGYLRFTFTESDNKLVKVQFFDFRSFDEDVYDTAYEMYGKPETESSYYLFEVSKDTVYTISEGTSDGENIFIQAYVFSE